MRNSKSEKNPRTAFNATNKQENREKREDKRLKKAASATTTVPIKTDVYNFLPTWVESWGVLPGEVRSPQCHYGGTCDILTSIFSFHPMSLLGTVIEFDKGSKGEKKLPLASLAMKKRGFVRHFVLLPILFPSPPFFPQRLCTRTKMISLIVLKITSCYDHSAQGANCKEHTQ